MEEIEIIVKCPKCRKPMVESKAPVYRVINILGGCPKYRHFVCDTKGCRNEVFSQQGE